MAHSLTAPLLDLEDRIVNLLGDIGEEEVNLLIDLLLRCDSESNREITLYISCKGGDLIQSLKLLDTLRILRSKVTAVGFGVIEGLGLLVLAACPKRLVFASTLFSTAGLWSLPTPHPDSRQTIGLGKGVDHRQLLAEKTQHQAESAFAALVRELPRFLVDPDLEYQLLNAHEALKAGLIDAIITSFDQRFPKIKSRKLTHVRSNIHSL